MTPLIQGMDNETMRLAFARDEARIIIEERLAARTALRRWTGLLAMFLAFSVAWLAWGPSGGTGLAIAAFLILPIGVYVGLAKFCESCRRLRFIDRQRSEHEAFLHRYRRDPAEFYDPRASAF